MVNMRKTIRSRFGGSNITFESIDGTTVTSENTQDKKRKFFYFRIYYYILEENIIILEFSGLENEFQ